ncbi:putative TOS1-like glycosyl hydrolase-domain-containing protein [Microdochium trichocladiopsis]|uniref:glucan endo-1,3-beta-D-glucosidase n=1 Tax=Microdochium trichocladiopsis TaxID=1682393 RepID=A0A9P8Y2I7_9PEZI|nr:putative TOS1-like glycosyl hydrolase-domain-containing protein [Microdochium trichocladiopsis]KAH7027708.1 putative TOS1-like glycosyl hydrolase-domain-containing protein [Microdochium trichocladiopsis]
MKYTSAVLAAAAATVNADMTAFNEGGNWFAGLAGVSQIKYGGLDIPGAYRAVSKMTADGVCEFVTKPYSGSIAPFDEDLSMHLRGPLKLASVAVYTPGTGKRDVPKPHTKRHQHGHAHLHKKSAEEKRADMVTAVIDGVTVSWENNWFGAAAAPTEAPAAAPAAAAPAAVDAAPLAGAHSAPSGTISSAGSTDSVPVGNFKRVGYYSAKDNIAEGLTFLANKGDPKVSGTWDTVWGSSLAYVSADGESCSAGPTVFNGDLSDGNEIAIYSDIECDESCGAVRPGSVAYKAFAGADKAFFFEFQMPDTGATGWNKNMPAIWALNGAIARTGQYSSCSCWKGDNASPIEGGCGEADIFEVLASGDKKAKSTFHFANALGDSHWFARPTDKTIKIAAVFQSSTSTATIKVLDDSFDFSTSLTGAQIESIVADEADTNLFSFMSFGKN